EAASALVVEVGQILLRHDHLELARVAAALVADLEIPAVGHYREHEAHPHVALQVLLVHRRLAAAVVDRVREQLAGHELEGRELARRDALASRELAQHRARRSFRAVRGRQVELELARRAGARLRGLHESGSSSSERSRDGAECVSAPTDRRSTPLRATSPTVLSSMPPEASSSIPRERDSARRRRTGASRASSAGVMLSSSTTSAPPSTA